MGEIPAELVINWDHTGVPVSNWYITGKWPLIKVSGLTYNSCINNCIPVTKDV